jgi:hypothetical protein
MPATTNDFYELVRTDINHWHIHLGGTNSIFFSPFSNFYAAPNSSFKASGGAGVEEHPTEAVLEGRLGCSALSIVC